MPPILKDLEEAKQKGLTVLIAFVVIYLISRYFWRVIILIVLLTLAISALTTSIVIGSQGIEIKKDKVNVKKILTKGKNEKN